MEIFRHTRDVYGQQVLEGISYELLWFFVGAALLVIAGHLLYKRFGDKGNG